MIAGYDGKTSDEPNGTPPCRATNAPGGQNRQGSTGRGKTLASGRAATGAPMAARFGGTTTARDALRPPTVPATDADATSITLILATPSTTRTGLISTPTPERTASVSSNSARRQGSSRPVRSGRGKAGHQPRRQTD